MEKDPRLGKMQPLVLLVRLDQRNLLWGTDLAFDLEPRVILLSIFAHLSSLPTVLRDVFPRGLVLIQKALALELKLLDQFD